MKPSKGKFLTLALLAFLSQLRGKEKGRVALMKVTFHNKGTGLLQEGNLITGLCNPSPL